MSYDMVKFDRGQIWKICMKSGTVTGREQDKDRPWLVLSVAKFNHSAGMITAVPITSRKFVRTPAQVLFTNSNNVPNVILCEQVRSFDYNSGEYEFEYLGTLSAEVLEKVDVAISIHLGLHYSPITLKSLYDSMESIIKSVGYMEQKNATPKFTDEDVAKFAEKLQSLAKHQEIEEQGEGRKPAEGEGIPKTPVGKKKAECVDKGTKSKKKRIQWTKDTCKTFLHDAENLPMNRVMEKWDISSKARFYSMKQYAQTLLKK